MTAKFQIVRYGHYDYGDIPINISELAAHFDIAAIQPNGRYSLHTEYSYGPRKFENKIFDSLTVLKESSKFGIPQLWFSEKWSIEFLKFIQNLINGHQAPEIIEIHPPFIDYCPDIFTFLKTYSTFETELSKLLPDTHIFLENRRGSQSRLKFLVENSKDITDLLSSIVDSDLKLQIALDIPTLLSTIKVLDMEHISLAFEPLRKYISHIGSIHIWGREKIPHMGSLDSLFKGDRDKKDEFLNYLASYFDDGKARYLVPEVNGTKQNVFVEILNDLKNNFDLT